MSFWEFPRVGAAISYHLEHGRVPTGNVPLISAVQESSTEGQRVQCMAAHRPACTDTHAGPLYTCLCLGQEPDIQAVIQALQPTCLL